MQARRPGPELMDVLTTLHAQSAPDQTKSESPPVHADVAGPTEARVLCVAERAGAPPVRGKGDLLPPSWSGPRDSNLLSACVERTFRRQRKEGFHEPTAHR